MNDKKSFVLYADYANFIKVMTNEQKGMLFQQILDYVNDGTDFEGDDPMVQMSWNMIKNNLDRDMEKWTVAKEERELKGKLGGILRALKAGQSVSEDNIRFLKENSLFNKEYLLSQGISESKVALLMETGRYT